MILKEVIMKKASVFVIALLAILVPVFVSAEGAAEAKGAVPEIRIISKDFYPTDPDNLAHIANIQTAFKAKTGLDVKLTLLNAPEGSYPEKLNLMLLSGDVPDIIYFQGGDETISNQGMLAALRPYAEKSEWFKKAMLPFNVKRLANYPYIVWLAPPRLNTPAIRSDWFAKWGGKVPNTVDDYYAMLKAFVSSDYDGNGKIDSIGLTDTGNTNRLDFLFNHAFGLTTTWLKDGSGKYVYSKASEFEKNKLAFYQKLYKEGILDKDYITTKWDGMEDKLYTAKIGMVVGTPGLVTDIYETKMAKAGKGDEYLVICPPAKGIAQGFTVDVSKEARGYAISAASKNKDLAWKILDFMASDEGQTLDRLGIEGIHHVKKDGKVALTEKFGSWYPRFSEVVGWKGPVDVLGKGGKESLAMAVKYATVEDINFVIPKDLAPAWDACNNVYKEWSFKFISGEYGMDKFADFTKAWYAAGGDKVTEYANKTLK